MAQPIATSQPLSSTTPQWHQAHGSNSQGGKDGGCLWAQWHELPLQGQFSGCCLWISTRSTIETNAETQHGTTPWGERPALGCKVYHTWPPLSRKSQQLVLSRIDILGMVCLYQQNSSQHCSLKTDRKTGPQAWNPAWRTMQPGGPLHSDMCGNGPPSWGVYWPYHMSHQPEAGSQNASQNAGMTF